MSDFIRPEWATGVYHARPALFPEGGPSPSPAWLTAGARHKRPNKRRSQGPLIAALIAGALIAVVVVVAGVAWGIRALTFDAPLRSWTPDPARVARFTQMLQIDEYALRAPPEAYEIRVRTPGLRPPMIRQQTKAWAVDNPDGSEKFRFTVRVLDLSEPDHRLSGRDPAELAAEAADEVSRNEGMSIESSSVDEGKLGNIEFAVFRFRAENPRRAAGQNVGYLLHALHISDLRHVQIIAMTRAPPESEAFAEMEAMLLTFRDRGGE